MMEVLQGRWAFNRGKHSVYNSTNANILLFNSTQLIAKDMGAEVKLFNVNVNVIIIMRLPNKLYNRD